MDGISGNEDRMKLPGRLQMFTRCQMGYKVIAALTVGTIRLFVSQLPRATPLERTLRRTN